MRKTCGNCHYFWDEGEDNGACQAPLPSWILDVLISDSHKEYSLPEETVEVNKKGNDCECFVERE
jgi:hypothetical protein